MRQRVPWLGVVALCISMSPAAVAQSIGMEAAAAIQTAHALGSRIYSYHRGPAAIRLPLSYCRTMSDGEYALKELARLASRALLLRDTGLALRLEQAGDRLSDELDQEEATNDQAGMTYDVYPCPASVGLRYSCKRAYGDRT